ncbi:MAG: 6,7-dimethyl-8-ribityllumazine synthase [Gammaproteobacteria bacterium]|nr:6,7-dimethyl-8-ribityllumazine synthase [Gammaproteobacteria bacterium]
MKRKFAIVVSQFNADITEKLLQGALMRLIEAGIEEENVTIVHVPGAVEIPLIAQLLAKTHQYHAIICLGAVIRGETSHYDYVCQQVSQGCQKIMLDYDMPVIFGVLTTNTVEQALARVGGKEGHKGKEAAEAAIMMVDIIKKLTTVC